MQGVHCQGIQQRGEAASLMRASGKGKGGRDPPFDQHPGTRVMIKESDPFDKIGSEPKSSQTFPQVDPLN